MRDNDPGLVSMCPLTILTFFRVHNPSPTGMVHSWQLYYVGVVTDVVELKDYIRALGATIILKLAFLLLLSMTNRSNVSFVYSLSVTGMRTQKENL